MDREKREAEANDNEKQVRDEQKRAEVDVEMPSGGGLFANIKGGEDILSKLNQQVTEEQS